MLKQPNFFFFFFAKQYDECHYIKKKTQTKKNKKKGTYIHRSKGRDTAIANANYCRPKTLIAKKN